MNYQETTAYLFNKLPEFQNIGKDAYKPGLENVKAFDKKMGQLHENYKTIHVAGTNGKGSVSHLLAAILQEAGYKVGLFTSPHLKDFRERIKVNGACVSENYVIDFVAQYKSLIEEMHPSFFEITTIMAFGYFAEQKVDVAIIEVGLGGRLDSTNIINPILSIITNISFDHTSLLGNTLEKIAAEKGGIIKTGVPVVIGSASPQVLTVFKTIAEQMKAQLFLAEKTSPVKINSEKPDLILESSDFQCFNSELKGIYQRENAQTVLTAVMCLRKEGFLISDANVHNGFSGVIELTGFYGRWQQLKKSPLIICDTAHNEAGIRFIVSQLEKYAEKRLRIVFGMVKDKDSTAVLALLPKDAVYYFTQAKGIRSLPATELKYQAGQMGLNGESYEIVIEALEKAKQDANEGDLIFIGGSNFIVAEVL